MSYTRTVTHKAAMSAALKARWAGVGGGRNARILAKVDKSGGPDACWPWTGHLDSNGYGIYKTKRESDGKNIPQKAHRLVYTILVGPIPDGLDLLHNCAPNPDLPACCNPKHLWPGTGPENTKDAAVKGQLVRGSDHPSARLTEDQVRMIRASRAAGVSPETLATQFGVSRRRIWGISTRREWKHVE